MCPGITNASQKIKLDSFNYISDICRPYNSYCNYAFARHHQSTEHVTCVYITLTTLSQTAGFPYYKCLSKILKEQQQTYRPMDLGVTCTPGRTSQFRLILASPLFTCPIWVPGQGSTISGDGLCSKLAQRNVVPRPLVIIANIGNPCRCTPLAMCVA